MQIVNMVDRYRIIIRRLPFSNGLEIAFIFCPSINLPAIWLSWVIEIFGRVEIQSGVQHIRIRGRVEFVLKLEAFFLFLEIQTP